jgi:hypothetical protein
MSAPKNMKNAEPSPSGPGSVSRRDFIATTAATGFGIGVTQSAPALAAGQAQGAGAAAVTRAENALPAKAQPREMYQGPPQAPWSPS